MVMIPFSLSVETAETPGGSSLSAREAEWLATGFATRLSKGDCLEIVRHPARFDFSRGAIQELPSYRPDSIRPFQVDLRSADLSNLDLSRRLEDLFHADFDSRTRWPAELPNGFDPRRMMELGTNPGLGLRELHKQGITGKGVGIAIIDQVLLVDHVEYKDRLKLYEEIHSLAASPAQMHGPAVASIAVGRSAGVAPEADLYYIAEMHIEPKAQGGGFDFDFTWLAKSIDRLLEVNARLPSAHRIRVISTSVGWSPHQKGYQEVTDAAARAKQAGVFLISTALEQTHGLAFHGLGREPLRDPDLPASFGLGSWWKKMFLDGLRRFPPDKRLLVPMDARATASPTGERDYVYYSSGGWSWSVPYLAGLYALACQVKPEITPEAFWTSALKTGDTVKIRQGDTEIELGNIVNPAALLKTLGRQN
ncbi:MAG: S8/S53 family peptidase [Verrucomicrobia bacterium]|nr:S8/S53 family peptidase [Verrucomicrobiota bacterium]